MAPLWHVARTRVAVEVAAVEREVESVAALAYLRRGVPEVFVLRVRLEDLVYPWSTYVFAQLVFMVEHLI